MIISARLDETDIPKIFKAPTGKMFVIWDIHFSVLSSGDNSMAIIPYAMDGGVAVHGLTSTEILSLMPMDIAGQAEDFSFTNGERTKMFSVTRQNANAFIGYVIIHYDLVGASKIDLLMEWFRKGR